MNFQLLDWVPEGSEFLSKWQITQDFIFNQTNPYEPQIDYVFKSPFPALFIYFPFALIEEADLAQAAWTTTIQLASLIFTYLCLRNTSWQTGRWQTGLLLIFAILWYPAVSTFMRGSTVSILGGFLLAAIFALQKDQDELAGVFLAFSALELRVALFSLLIILIWLISHRKWLSFFWAGVVFLFKSGIGLIFLPSWPVDFFWATLRHTNFQFGEVIIDTTTRWWPGIGEQVGWAFIMVMATLLLIEWWLVFGKSAKRLTWTLALTGIIAIWIGLETNLDHVYLTLFSLIIIFAAWNRRWGRSGLIFSWIAISILLPGLWWAASFFQAREIADPLNPIIMIGYPLLALLGLYWVRWWYLRPDYLVLNES